MKIRDVDFIKSAFKEADFPVTTLPEFAFMGRSNVGKSSLINMVVGRRGLVKTGGSPGVTRSINFFHINNSVLLADLPGYGYAKLPAAVHKTFLPLIKKYVSGRENLKLVFLLIDIRRTPGDFEREMITLLAERNIPTAIVATKCDKLSNNQRPVSLRTIADALGIERNAVFLSSTKSGEGKRDILRLIGEYS